MVYLPIIIILALFVAIMLVLRRHMAIMGNGIKGPTSRRSQCRKQRKQANEFMEGRGISFNPAYPLHEDDGKEETGFGNMTPICWRKYNKALDRENHSDLDEEGLQYYSIFIQVEKERLGRPFFRQGKFYRSVGTSVSPERYGLVKSIGVNTSPDLEFRPTSALPDVTQNAPRTMCTFSEEEIQVITERGLENVSQDISIPIDCKEKIVSLNSLAKGTSDSNHGNRESVSRQQSSQSSAYSAIEQEDGETNIDSEGDMNPNRTHFKRRHRHYASLLRAQRHGVLERARLKQQLRAARMLGTIMTFLLMCWLPFAILWPSRVFCPQCISQHVYDISIWINYANSACNPVIYFLSNPHCRKAFRNILTRCKR